MSIEGVSGSKEPLHHHSPPIQRDWSKAQSTYNKAIETLPNRDERHAEVGILFPNGTVDFAQLGKKEEYGAHRVGSVTKTFTTFLALKLMHDGALPHGLNTTCGELFEPEFLAQIFEDPHLAKEMTLEQLLSHTSGLEHGDHCRDQQVSAPSLRDRFVQEAGEGRKYRHITHPGDRIGWYSNAGLAVAGLMLEKAYNDFNDTQLSFAQIMQHDLFEKVFNMKESFVKPGPTKDPIQSPAGDMSSSTADLIEAARVLQQGEEDLEKHFGQNWQKQMLAPRDLLQQHGLGCEAGITSIEHKGLNRESFGNEERDVSAIVIFPLRPKQAGLVAMCDSNALGPSDEGQAFIHSLESLVAIEELPVSSAEQSPQPAPVEFYCPDNEEACLFHGSAFLVTDCNPFEVPDKIQCSLNGTKYALEREPNLDQEGIHAYKDQSNKEWLVIVTQDKREIILSPYGLFPTRQDTVSLEQPSIAEVRSVTGIYRNAITPDEHPTFYFTERNGQLFVREGIGKEFPCLYIPERKAWVNAMQPSMQFQFPENPDASPLVIKDIFSGDHELPKECHRVHRNV